MKPAYEIMWGCPSCVHQLLHVSWPFSQAEALYLLSSWIFGLLLSAELWRGHGCCSESPCTSAELVLSCFLLVQLSLSPLWKEILLVTPRCWAGGETGRLTLFSNVIYHALLGGCADHLLINPAYLFLFLSFLSLLLSLFHIENQKDAGEQLYMHYKLLGLLSYIYFVFHSSLRYVLLQAENGDALILKELICAVYITSFVSILRIECRLEVPCSNRVSS